MLKLEEFDKEFRENLCASRVPFVTVTIYRLNPSPFGKYECCKCASEEWGVLYVAVLLHETNSVFGVIVPSEIESLDHKKALMAVYKLST